MTEQSSSPIKNTAPKRNFDPFDIEAYIEQRWPGMLLECQRYSVSRGTQDWPILTLELLVDLPPVADPVGGAAE